MVVLPQFLAFDPSADAVRGALWALAAAICTGCGTVLAARNQRSGPPVTVIMGWSALSAAIFAFGWAVASGAELLPAVSAPYVAGLLYLAILASCVTFAMYFSLVHRIGPAAASYALSSVPRGSGAVHDVRGPSSDSLRDSRQRGHSGGQPDRP